MKNGINSLTEGSKQLNSGLNQLEASQTKASVGLEKLQLGAAQVANGNMALATSWTKMGNAVGSLNAGLTQISAGNQTVANGWGTMATGVTKLNEGTEKLYTGSQELSSGFSDGAKQVSKINNSESNITMFSNPVQLSGEKENKYQYYRDSTAPYILSLGLFVGMLMLSFVIDFKRPAILPASAWSWYASKWMKLALFAIIQGLIVSIFSVLILKLQVTSVEQFIFFSAFVSVAFMTIIFFLVSLAGNIGRFAAFALIVLQLTITGANLPIPMLPEKLQLLSQYLPLTYSNAGFKSIISLGDSSLLMSNSLVIFINLVVFSVLALIVFLFSYKSLKRKMSEKDAVEEGLTV